MELIIRAEEEKDYYASELVTKRAFWNKHHPGCDEHYLVHRLRSDKAYIPALSRVAEADGKIVGLILYARASLETAAGSVEVLTFGPLCVDPDFQRRGIGGRLLSESLRAAEAMGFRAVIIFGEPDYYPLHGFSTCDKWGITTAEGQNSSAFMGRELITGGLDYPGARFFDPPVYFDLPKEAVEAYDKRFPYMEKRRLPGQWPD